MKIKEVRRNSSANMLKMARLDFRCFRLGNRDILLVGKEHDLAKIEKGERVSVVENVKVPAWKQIKEFQCHGKYTEREDRVRGFYRLYSIKTVPPTRYFPVWEIVY